MLIKIKKEIDGTNAIDLNSISKEEQETISTKLLERLEPVAKEIVPNYEDYLYNSNYYYDDYYLY